MLNEYLLKLLLLLLDSFVGSTTYSESESEVAQSCLTLCDPKDCSLPASSVHGIFHARVLEWGAIAFSDKWPYGLLNIKTGSLEVYTHISEGCPRL